MPKYVIERDLPGAGSLSQQDLCGVAVKSNAVIEGLGPSIQWLHSYVTGDKIYCVYMADNPEVIKEHASRGGFPCNVINEVKAIIDPSTANAA